MPHVLHEGRVDAPKHWEKTARLEPDVVLPMPIGLTHSNLDIGDEFFMEMYFSVLHETLDNDAKSQEEDLAERY